MTAVRDMTGQRFWHLTVVCRAPRKHGCRQAIWICACACGDEVIATGSDIRRGHRKSCTKCKGERVRRKNRETQSGPDRAAFIIASWEKKRARDRRYASERKLGRIAELKAAGLYRNPYTLVDMTGMKFGDWTVICLFSRATRTSHTKWLCRCACGKERPVTGQALRRSETTRCQSCAVKLHWERRYALCACGV